MPPLIAVIMHGGLALFMVFSSLQGADGLLKSHPCRVYGRPKDDKRLFKCREWAEKFHVLLWAYLISVLIIGYALQVLGATHICLLFLRFIRTALFIFSCSSPFRDQSWRRGLSTWKFPTGQMTVEFTIKFLRQDAPVPVAPNEAPAANEA